MHSELLHVKIQGIFFRSLQKVTWKNCLKAAEKKFKYAIGHLYVNEVQAGEKNENDIGNVQGRFKNYAAVDLLFCLLMHLS